MLVQDVECQICRFEMFDKALSREKKNNSGCKMDVSIHSTISISTTIYVSILGGGADIYF